MSCHCPGNHASKLLPSIMVRQIHVGHGRRVGGKEEGMKSRNLRSRILAAKLRPTLEYDQPCEPCFGLLFIDEYPWY